MKKISGIEEIKLIERMREGDKSAFELLFRYYYSGLLVFASQIVFNEEEAREIVQDFFVRLWENRKGINTDKSFKSYLFTSVKNRSINLLKKAKQEESLTQEFSELIDKHPVFDPDVFVATELQEKIKKAIDELPNRCAEVFVLSRMRGFSNDEIAEELQISKRTVETQISNALKILRVELKDYAGLLLLLELFKF